MKHRGTESFWQLYEALPEQVRVQADKAYELLKQDSRHPSLHFKRLSVSRASQALFGRIERSARVLPSESLKNASHSS